MATTKHAPITAASAAATAAANAMARANEVGSRVETMGIDLAGAVVNATAAATLAATANTKADALAERVRDMEVVTYNGETFNVRTLGDLITAVKSILRKMGANVSVVVAMCVLSVFGATADGVTTKTASELDGESDTVVTAIDTGRFVTTNEVAQIVRDNAQPPFATYARQGNIVHSMTAENAVYDAEYNEIHSTYATKVEIADKADNSALERLADDLGELESFSLGKKVRGVLTNYFGRIDIPSFYIEQQVEEPSEELPNGRYEVKWDERTRWNRFLTNDFARLEHEVYSNRADRAWGVYDSASGEYSPDGVLQISQSEINISGKMSWKCHGDGVWVMTMNNPMYINSGEGSFVLHDAMGELMMEVVQGGKAIAGAHIFGIAVRELDAQTTQVEIPVRIDKNVKFTSNSLRADVATTLSGGGDFQDAASAPGMHVVYGNAVDMGDYNEFKITFNFPKHMYKFFRAWYEKGTDSYVRYGASHSADQLTIGGTNYNVHVESVTINGATKKILVLE